MTLLQKINQYIFIFLTTSKYVYSRFKGLLQSITWTLFPQFSYISKISKFNFSGWFKKPISGFLLTSETRFIFQNFHHLKRQYPDGNILLVTSFVCENWCFHILKSIWEIILKISWKSSYISNWQKHGINKP